MWCVIICMSSFRYFRQSLHLSLCFSLSKTVIQESSVTTAAIISLFWWFHLCVLAILFTELLVAVWLWLNPSGFSSRLKECGFNSYSAQKAKAEPSKNDKLSTQMHKQLLSVTVKKARTPNDDGLRKELLRCVPGECQLGLCNWWEEKQVAMDFWGG